MEMYVKIEELINQNSRTLVGILIKRIELLENNNLTFNQIKNIYKSLVKEEVYENARGLLKLLRANIDIGAKLISQRPDKKE
jgi:hypothetical protein